MGFKAPTRKGGKKTIEWGFDFPTEWAKLSEIWEKKPDPDAKYEVRALFISKDRGYGNSPVIVTKKHLVSLPQHLLDEVKEILDNEESIQAIKDGEVRFTVYTYKSHGKDCYSINWDFD